MNPPRPEPPATTLDETLGIESFDFDGEATATARMPVVDAVKQPYGIVHGGAYASLAESLCSRATYEAVSPGRLALGQSNATTFLRPVSEGFVEARATAQHRGRTSWVWDVVFTGPDGRTCALSRLIIAVREAEGAGS